MKNPVEKLLANPVCFLSDAGGENPVAVSTRIRLARNLEGRKFPAALNEDEMREICDTVYQAAVDGKAFGRGMLDFRIDELSAIDRELLLERRLASRDFLNRPCGTRLLASADEADSVMINEEDHLRLQSLSPGFHLEEVWTRIDRIDDRFSEKIPFAFDSKLGFLTGCPTNVGTGMRASVMLHLPGLVLSNRIGPVIQGINKLNFAVRGIFGEGTENLGNLYQISNQSTLGEKETDIIENLKLIIQQIMEHELAAREHLLRKDRYFLLDLIGRAYGTLRFAYKLSSEEAIKSLSLVRLGVDIGVFTNLTSTTVNALLIAIAPAHLQKNLDLELDAAQRDVARANNCREQLKKANSAEK